MGTIGVTLLQGLRYTVLTRLELVLPLEDSLRTSNVNSNKFER